MLRENRKKARRRRIMKPTQMAVGLSVLIGLCVSTAAWSEDATPAELTPPPGNTLFLTAHARGTQNYICLPASSGGNAWVFYSPQATLSLRLSRHFRQQILTHFLSPLPAPSQTPQSGCTVSPETDEVNCPTWQSSFDSSRVWGTKVASINAGTDPSCPATGAIPCLLLKAVATSGGPSTLLKKTTFIQRLNTWGGSAPTGACQVGDQALVQYRADYSFFSADDNRP